METKHLKSKLKDLEEIKAGYEGARHLQNAQARRGAAAPHTDVAESAGARLSTFMSELSPGEIAYFHWKDETVHGEGLGRLLAKEYIDYDMAVKEIINPSDADVIALYGGPGADIINFLLSINTARGYWVDGTVVDARELNRLLKDEWDNLEKSKVALKYLKDKKVDGYGQSYGLRMDDIHLKILLELKMMDVPRESIRVRKRGKHTVLRFDWTYPGKKRSVIK